MAVLVIEEDKVDGIVGSNSSLIHTGYPEFIGNVTGEVRDLMFLLRDPFAEALVSWSFDVRATLAIQALEDTNPQVAVVKVHLTLIFPILLIF